MPTNAYHRHRLAQGRGREVHHGCHPGNRARARRGTGHDARLRPERLPRPLGGSGGAAVPHQLSARVGEAEIVRTIQSHDEDGSLVIVDLEGVASRLASRAISQTDLVVTPMRASTMDATIGVRG